MIPASLGANFVLNATDAAGTTSFNTGLHWPGGAAPAPGNTYQTGAFQLRTPTAVGDFTFLGDSLEIQAGGSMRIKTAGTITINNLILANTAVVELTQPNAVNTAAAAGTLAGNITLNGTATLHAGINTDVAGETFTITSIIGGTGGFTTTGSNGKIILTSSNTFSGGATLAGLANSTVQLGNAGAVQNSTITASRDNSLAFSTGIGTFNVGGLASTGAFGVTLNDTAGAAVMVAVGGNNASTTYSGSLTGLGGLTKVGSGTLTLSGLNSYSGVTTINAGRIDLSGSLVSTGPMVVNTGGILNVSGDLGVENAVTVSGGGVLSGRGDGVVTGVIAGTVSLASGTSASTRGAINLTDGTFGTLTLSKAAGLSIGGAAGESAQLTFEAGVTESDLLSLDANPLTVNAGGALISITNIGVVANRIYTLLKFGSGAGAGFATGSGATVGGLTLTNPNLTFGVTGNLLVGATQVQLVTSGASAPATAYWSGIRGTQWTDNNGTLGNFTTDAAGTNFIQAYPSAMTDVIFANAAPTNLGGSMLGQDFSIKSLRFASGVAAAVISGGNNLTIGTGGITVASGNGGATLSMASLTLGDAQTWVNASAQSLVVSANVKGSGALAINNTSTGVTTFAGANTHSGGTTLSAGVLRMSGSGTLGAANSDLTVSAGRLELNGTNQSVGNLTGAGGQIVNNGSVNSTLSVGNGDGMGGNFAGVLADTNNASAGTLGLAKVGSGTLTLSGANTYTGPTTLSGGFLSIASISNGGVASGIGQAASAAGNLVFDGGTLEYTGPNATTNRDFTITTGKTAVLDIATAKLTMTGVAAASTGGFTKLGAGELTFPGVHAYAGVTTVSRGVFTLTGTLNSAAALGTGGLVVGNVNGNDAVMRIDGGMVNIGGNGPTAGISGSIGAASGSSGSITMTSGAITSNSGTVKQNINVGISGYGAFTMSGGAVSLAGNFGAGTASGGTGVQNFSGGSVTVTGGYGGILGNVGNGIGVANYTGTSSFTAASTIAAPVGFVGMVVGEGGTGILNVSGQASLTLGGLTTSVGLDLGRNSAATVTGIVNLGAVAGGGSGGVGGGTITTNIVRHTGAAAAGVFNFHGGILKAATFAAPGFMTGLTGAYIYGEGGTIDTNGVAISIAQPLLAPTGQGLTSAPLSAIGTGYINAPIVTIIGGTPTANGTQATAVARFNAVTGEVTGITITNPGSYTDTTGLTAFFMGGGVAATAPTPDVFVTAANASGGLTKTGAGTLTLSGVNTYTGATSIEAGTLALTGSLSGSTAIDVKSAATFDVSGVAGFSVASGQTLKGSGTVLGALTVGAGATLSPGNSPGTLTTATLSLDPTSTSAFELTLGNTTAGGGINDLVIVNGDLTLDGTLQITQLGGSLTGSGSYVLFDYSGTLTNNTLEIGAGFLASHPNAHIYIDTVNTTVLLAIPEPGVFGSLLTGLGMLGLRRRRNA